MEPAASVDAAMATVEWVAGLRERGRTKVRERKEEGKRTRISVGRDESYLVSKARC